MTVEEAINYIIRHCNPDYPNGKTEWETAVNMAIDALKKQIPAKPVKSDKPRYGMGYEYYDWRCPTCDRLLAFETQRDRLPQICKCGQKIDWSEEEDDREAFMYYRLSQI